jgi:hypothetical protein
MVSTNIPKNKAFLHTLANFQVWNAMHPCVRINYGEVMKDLISLEKVLNILSKDGAKEIDDDFCLF